MSLPNDMQTALERPSFLFFTAQQFDLPDRTVRLLDGEGTIELDGEAFAGSDSTYGGLGAIEAITDGVDEQAPRVRVTVNVPDTSAAQSLSNPNKQGSAVQVWWGVADPITSTSIGHVLVFVGEVDVPVFRPGVAQRSVEVDVASVWDRLLDSDDGARLNPAYEEAIWPGDKGCQFVTRLIKDVEWGSETVGSDGVSYGGGGGGSGGGGLLL